MYQFEIKKFGKGVTLTGFPDVHYGMGFEDLQNLKQVIDEFLQNQSNPHSCLGCFHFHKNNYDHFKRYESVKKENNFFTCRCGNSVDNPDQDQECFISRSSNQSMTAEGVCESCDCHCDDVRYAKEHLCCSCSKKESQFYCCLCLERANDESQPPEIIKEKY